MTARSYVRRNGVWVPKTPELLLRRTKEVAAGGGVRLAGFFTIEARDERGRVVERRQFRNLITDAFLNWLGGSLLSVAASSPNAAQYGFVGVGSGANAPANTDTALQTQIARINTSQIGAAGVNTTDNYAWQRRTVVFAAGVGTGTWAEIGVFHASSGGAMMCRALVTDENGTPQPFTKSAGIGVTVTHELRFYFGDDTTYQDFTIGAGSYDLTVRALNVHTQNGDGWGATDTPINRWGFNGNQTGTPGKLISESGGLLDKTTNSTTNLLASASYAGPQSYVNGNFYLEQAVQWNTLAAQRQFRLLGFAMNTSTRPFYQVLIDDGLGAGVVVDVGQSLTLVWRFTWGRA